MRRTAVLEKGATEAASTRLQLIADLFHALNQPLTGLRCSLELTLDHPRGEEQYRGALRTALQQAEQIARLSGNIRDLLQAEDPGDAPQVLAFDAYLQDAVAEWQPIAESQEVLMLLDCVSAWPVYIEPRRLRRALFHLLEFVFSSAATGAVVELEAAQSSREAVTLSISCDAIKSIESVPDAESKALDLSRRLGLAIARGIFEAAGGSLQTQDQAESLHLKLRLPLMPVSAGGSAGSALLGD